ncbi:protein STRICTOSIDINE SYNTHASE-LIKE 13 isoform X1 [Selaginella moellendorffii]|nr:protein STRICTOSIDINE SYNTHASE-LIKE 13 isoform X1 [Selaginella moellendorffii]|eukprot:XP_002979343.2 protein STRICTOSIDINE SYNTHASE-LIKE 13 isoform X1 [Selaginella moellendorffii]
MVSPERVLDQSMELNSKDGAFSKLKNKKRFVSIAIIAATAAILCAILPGPLGGLKYYPVKHQIAPLKSVLPKWPSRNDSLLQFASIEFQDRLFGPESIEFDPQGNGPYTGLGDGRIVRWMPDRGWETFALSSINWNREECDNGDDPRRRVRNEHVCGRPLGLRFDPRSGDLYIADSYYGLLVVGPKGGIARPLVSEVEGIPIKFANDLDVHPNGSVYFTDTSTRWNRRLHHMVIVEGENTGRLLRYDPNTGNAVVVLRGLAFANGVQLASDQSFLLVVETTNCRVLKLWLKGNLTGTLEVFADLPGYPDNVRINDKGQFWVAIDCCRNRIQEIMSSTPWLKSLVFRVPVPLSWIMYVVGEKMYSVAALFDKRGRLLRRLEDREARIVKLISEVYEKDGKIWFGTVVHDQITSFILP